MYKYKARSGRQISDKQAEIYGPEILKIQKEKGRITPEIIVNEASKKKSPLHEFFDWEDSEAAIKWRKQQARNLIKSIEIIVEETPEVETVALFFNVQNSEGQKYVSVYDVMDNEEYRRELVERALNEIKRWEKQYKHLNELKSIFSEIGKTQKKLKLAI